MEAQPGAGAPEAAGHLQGSGGGGPWSQPPAAQPAPAVESEAYTAHIKLDLPVMGRDGQPDPWEREHLIPLNQQTWTRLQKAAATDLACIWRGLHHPNWGTWGIRQRNEGALLR